MTFFERHSGMAMTFDRQRLAAGWWALSVSALTLASASVSAQTPPNGEPSTSVAPAEQTSEGLEDIVVTATRQRTNLQDTPLAVTAVTADTLAQRSITTTAELGAIVPNATFRQAPGGFGRSVSAFIRGIGQSDGNLALEPGVAFYVDDTYYPLVLGSLFDLLDLDHVEVLRGPQGTLFGRNALAGAVNLVSKPPSNTPSGYVDATYGRFNRLELRGGFNLPLSDNLALRMSGVSKTRRGYQKRLDFRCEMLRRGTPELAGTFPFFDAALLRTPSQSQDSCVVGYNGGEDVHAGRASLQWSPTRALKVTVTGDYTKDESEVQADSLIAVNPATALANTNARLIAGSFTTPGGTPFAYDGRFLTGNPYTTYATYGDPLGGGTVIPGTFYNGSPTRGGLRNRPVNPVTNWGVSAKFVYGLTNSIDAIFIAGYRDVTTAYTFDVDGSPLPFETTRNITTHQQHTLELRLSGKSSFIDWTAGLFYYRAHELVRLSVVSPYNNLQRAQNNRYEPKSKSAYANVTVRPLDGLGITLGGRYSDDEKPVNYDNRQDGNPAGDILFRVKPSERRFDWKAGVDYHVTKDTMVYASAATGFRLPSFNPRPLQASQVSPVPGDEILAYELGVKTDLFDRRLRVNAAAFYTDYKKRTTTASGQEYQLGANGQPLPGNNITIPFPTGGSGATICRPLTAAEIAAGTPGFACIGRTYYVNTPGKVKGVELEIEARPIDNLTVNFSGGYSKFDSPDLKAAGRVNQRLPNIPDWTASAGIQYAIPAKRLAGSITPRLDWMYQGSIVYSPTSKQFNQPGYSVFNGRLTYANDADDVSVSFSVTNLFNKFYYYNIFDYQALGFPNVNAQPSRPREWAISIGKRF